MNKLDQRGFSLVEGMLIVISLLLVGGVGFYVYNSNKPKEIVQSTEANNEVKKGEKTNSVQSKLPELVEYPQDIVVQSKQDIVKLTSASDSFKKFIDSKVGNEPKYETDCENPITITVKKIYKDQFALGGEGSCGGAAIVWKKTNSTWAQVIGMQQTPDCATVKEKGIPHQIIEKCFADPNGDPVDNPL